MWPLEPFRDLHRESLRDLEGFWDHQARTGLRWRKPYTRVLEWNPPFARWFPDGELNASEQCLDRHLDGPNRNKVAYYWEGELGEKRSLTYEDLFVEVTRLATGLQERGFGPRDRVALYLPMIPELPVTMLALARLGIPFTTVFSGFSARALGERLKDTGARLLVTADGGYRRGQVVPLKAIADEALTQAPGVESVIVAERTKDPGTLTPGRDVRWRDFVVERPPASEPPSFPSNHVLFMLYSSGTTGHPKAIAHSTGGYLTHVTATMRWVFGPQPSDRFWCAADVGWVTGHSYIVFAPLALGLSSILYEGALDYPKNDRLWEMIARYRATILYTSPTALRALRKNGDAPARAHDLGSLRLLGTVGEAINPSVWWWYYDTIGGGRCPIVDTWWQTETGGIMLSAVPGLAPVPMKPGSATFAVPGVEADVVGETGAPTAPGEKGYLVIRRPWPGMLLTLLGDDERYRQVYWSRFPGAYYPGDYALKDADGYFWLLGRADEVLKVAGHRIGTIEVEDALLTHPAVAEAAVCPVPDEVKGEVPVAFVVLKAGRAATPALAEELAERVAAEIGKIARPATVHFVTGLPKTRSGKIMRRVVRAVAQGEGSVGDVSTLEDGASVDEIRRALAEFTSALGPTV